MTSRGELRSLSRSSVGYFARVGAAVALAVLLRGVAEAVCGDGNLEGGEGCDDGNTVDGDCCSSTCTFESNGSPCSGTTLCRQSGQCDGSGTCEAVPRGGCRTAVKSSLKMKDNNGNDAMDKMRWKWSHGEATSLQEFGVPTGTTNYALCIYAAGDLISEAEIAANPYLWLPTSDGYKYKDPGETSDGIRKVRLEAGEASEAKASVQGKGENLPDPMLNLPLPVTVQLVNTENLCLGAVYDMADVEINNPARFKATAINK
jgi:cysteine-rich repeat protein